MKHFLLGLLVFGLGVLVGHSGTSGGRDAAESPQLIREVEITEVVEPDTGKTRTVKLTVVRVQDGDDFHNRTGSDSGRNSWQLSLRGYGRPVVLVGEPK